jgi:hypothetical protein
MGDESDKKLVIDAFTGAAYGHHLLGCYFKVKNDGKFTFHDKDDHVKGRDIRVGSDFSFTLDEDPGVTWRLTLNSDANEVLTGNWSDGRDPSEADGTYQAEAGGSGAEEDASAASAGGCAS